MGFSIDRCICFQRTFAELQEVAQTHGIKRLEVLQEHIPFGGNCGLCHPYVRRMLRTGEVVFQELLTPKDEPSSFEQE
jgi:bacterioferritin-associated ferredoxin